ncbi:unnamed protein product [Eruca vesicaria subsp. sativa]|uniref:Ornithine aminotransferase n=1 Tax=Eruca vesicaria subsp. sativa TaxID=29727 RepID=A0ABC8LNB7_ERUVS|nr:unnamed protein product [Eruca vesicaria subsp. sativa]
MVLYMSQNGFCILAGSFVCFSELSLLLDVLCKFYLVCDCIFTILFRLCFLMEMAQPYGTLMAKICIDFLTAYSAVTQEHCHLKIIKALQEQVETLSLSSRALYNDKFPVFAVRLTNMFGYQMVLPTRWEF